MDATATRKWMRLPTRQFSGKCSATHRTARTWNWEMDLTQAITGNQSKKSKGCGCAETSSLLNASLPCSPQSKTAMRFGDLPLWAAELSHSIRKVVLASASVLEPVALGSIDNVNPNACSFPSDLFCREPLFDN